MLFGEGSDCFEGWLFPRALSLLPCVIRETTRKAHHSGLHSFKGSELLPLTRPWTPDLPRLQPRPPQARGGRTAAECTGPRAAPRTLGSPTLSTTEAYSTSPVWPTRPLHTCEGHPNCPRRGFTGKDPIQFLPWWNISWDFLRGSKNHCRFSCGGEARAQDEVREARLTVPKALGEWGLILMLGGQGMAEKAAATGFRKVVHLLRSILMLPGSH